MKLCVLEVFLDEWGHLWMGMGPLLWRGCVSLLAMASSAQVCPGSPSAPVRAKCYMAVRFDQPCVRVRAEAEARIAAGPAFDPHNGGLYSLLTSSSPASLAGQRTTGSGSAPTHYTDRFTLTFNASSLAGGGGGEGCLVSACSESQGRSHLDFSTNYCNLRILYCGDADGCPSLGEPNLGYEESFVDCGHGATHSSADCLPHSSAHGLPPSPAPLSAPLSPPWDRGPPVSLSTVFMVLFLVLICATLACLSQKKRARSGGRATATGTSSSVEVEAAGDVADPGQWSELNDAARQAVAAERQRAVGEGTVGEPNERTKGLATGAATETTVDRSDVP